MSEASRSPETVEDRGLPPVSRGKSNVSPNAPAYVSLLATMLTLCGCSHRLRRTSALDAYRQIQVHEAQLARSQQHISHMTRTDPLRQREVDALCTSSRALCELADALRERDASERCTRGREVCTAEHAAMSAARGGAR